MSDKASVTNDSTIDVCVRHQWTRQTELTSYMSADWQEYVGRPGSLPGGRGARPILLAFPWFHPNGGRAAEASVGEDTPAGSDPEMVAGDLFDHGAAERCILTHDALMYTPAMTNPYLAREVARAANDWTIDRWLSSDDRFHGLVLVPNQSPDQAAAEVRRVGEHGQMVGVLMAGNGIGKPFGHPLCHPIFEAACELDLPIVIHTGGDAVPDATTQTTAGGLPATYSEYRALAAQPLMTHLISFIGQGVFEKFPTLRLVLMGGGVAWIPGILWRFDTNYKGFRRETPWVKDLPSTYFRRRVSVATYPLDAPRDPASLRALLESFGGLEDVLCYGSGYPDRECNTPPDVMNALPEAWRSKVMHENARRVFRLPPAAATQGKGSPEMHRAGEPVS